MPQIHPARLPAVPDHQSATSNAEKDPRLPGFADCQMLAIARHAETGQVHCLVGDARSTTICVMPEADAISAGHQLIDAILWSTETAADDGLDPALLA